MSCGGTEVDWDGLSTFKTRAQNPKLAVSGGKLSGPIEVVKEDVNQVELRIERAMSFMMTKQPAWPSPPIQYSNGNNNILHRGLHIEIKKTITDFSATNLNIQAASGEIQIKDIVITENLKTYSY